MLALKFRCLVRSSSTAKITACWKQKIRSSLSTPKSELGGSLALPFVDPCWACRKWQHSVIPGEDATERRLTHVVLKYVRKITWNLFWQNGLNFEWSDGTRSLFTFWEDDESQAFGSCVYIDTSGHWKSANCEQFLQGAVCHVPPSKSLKVYIKSLHLQMCVLEWKYVKGG